MANEDLLKIDCTTIVITFKNTRTNKVYKDEAEKDADIADPNTETTSRAYCSRSYSSSITERTKRFTESNESKQ
jgi:hypothetical protein